jgi:predicted TPR repeat methyltransferase
MTEKSSGWSEVWNSKTADRADWNGFESCFPNRVEYEAYAEAMARFIRTTLRINSDDVVLDLGCGTGLVASAVAQDARRVIAFDYSEIALTVARDRRSRDNIVFEWADLNEIDLEKLRNATKAYAVGSLYYLDTPENVFRVLDFLAEQGTELLAIDLPDANVVDARQRQYDTSQYRHLKFTESDFRDRYKGVTVHRGLYENYVNDSSRFAVHIRSTA